MMLALLAAFPFFLLAAYQLGFRRGVIASKAQLLEAIRTGHEVCETFNRLSKASSVERDAWFAGFRREYPGGVHVAGVEEVLTLTRGAHERAMR